ncbi:MAG: hypothetical protein CVV25_04510 [Ignavibacteriae bacterium HGW-Ignavibacteriae-4]|jgi:beta-phosphoglucomutase-like phosphatase (HAD superfamily)|nr:MAG: hypothetical protein CVV25_04510 [Ignavibacteriae bacterium HGW-Ignavibacteriae-4]
MKRLLLFDIDGTILNMKMGVSKNIFIDTFFDIYGQSISIEQMPRFSGNTDLQILNQMADAIGFDRELVAQKVEDFWNLKLDRFKQYCTTEFIELIPGIDKLLESLKSNDEYELSLVTGNSIKNAFQKLSSYQLDRYFTDGAFGNDNSDRNLLPPIALDRVNHRVGDSIYSNNNTVIIGDTNSDLLAAKTNNMKAIIIAKIEDYPAFQEQNADSLITDFLDIDQFYNEMERIYN